MVLPQFCVCLLLWCPTLRLAAVVYYRDPLDTDDNPRRIKEYHFCLSDDRKHDPYWVKAALRSILADIQQDGRAGSAPLSLIKFWTDGCAGQFKSRYVVIAVCLSHLFTRV